MSACADCRKKCPPGKMFRSNGPRKVRLPAFELFPADLPVGRAPEGRERAVERLAVLVHVRFADAQVRAEEGQHQLH